MNKELKVIMADSFDLILFEELLESVFVGLE
jgi:hypothetical protein